MNTTPGRLVASAALVTFTFASCGSLSDDQGPAENGDAAFASARTGDHRKLEQVLNAGFGVDTKNARGDTLLVLATYYGHKPAVMTLLGHGADTNLTNADGMSALTGAAFRDELPLMTLLVAHGANLNSRDNQGRTPLMWAAMFGKARAAAALIDLGAAQDLRDRDGKSAFDLAYAQGHTVPGLRRPASEKPGS